MIETSESPLSPATLFIDLWHVARNWTSPQRTNAARCKAVIETEVRDILKLNDARLVHDKLSAIAMPIDVTSPESRGRVLHVMHSIDREFQKIHPRNPKSPKISSLLKIPDWLIELRDRRRLFSHYSFKGDYRLIPRGALVRRERPAIASFAENFFDRFPALVVVPKSVMENDKSIEIIHTIISSSASSGVARGKNTGSEHIAVIPIAERKEDLLITSRKNPQSGQNYVDFRPSPELNVSEKILGSLTKASCDAQVDIVLMPELVVSESDSHKIQKKLVRLRANRPRLIVAGSGLTEATEESQPWNESAILNGYGKVLWRHRKTWPAGINNEKCIKYRIASSEHSLTYEDTAAGNTITVADIDTLGRCVVLICQDLERALLIDELIIKFQPDWVICPILDSELAAGSWAHRRAFSLSERSHARFLMATSTSLASYESKTNVSCSLAVGPRDKSDDDQGRLFLEGRCTIPDESQESGLVTFRWRSDGWSQTVVK